MPDKIDFGMENKYIVLPFGCTSNSHEKQQN